MNNELKNIEDILNKQVTGFHQYSLNDPVHITFASSNLCEMLDLNMNYFSDETRDCYASLVHPADADKYSSFIHELSAKEQTLTKEYRLVKKDGTIMHVRDTATSKKDENGAITATSVLTDITDLKNDHEDLKFFNESIPCGFLRYTCEKQPRITYINQTMIDILRFPKVADGEMDYLEMLRSNIFLTIPMEERRKFSKYLGLVYSSDAPIAGEISLLRCDGTRAYVFGWVTKTINEDGVEEFQSVCMDITERHQTRKARETMRYLRGLSDVYDKIFEFNLNVNTVKCLHCDDESSFKRFEDVAMQLEDAVEKWIIASVVKEDQSSVSSFFTNFSNKNLYRTDSKPPQIAYRAIASDGKLKQYTGIFIKVDDSISFFCCRELQNMSDTIALKNENTKLKENMKNLVTQFSDGIAAFEVSPEGLVKPLYATENVCEFFGYTQDEWLPLTEKFTPLENFVMYSEAKYEDFTELIRKGEAMFSYFDYHTQSERKIKAVFSQKEANSQASRYVMLYPISDEAKEEVPTLMEKRTVSIRTFGYFDVFVGDKPIAFSNKKSKELLALLVDRKGGYVTSEEAIGFLWEDESANSVTYSRYRKVALRLKNTLEEYGIPHIIESVDGKRRIVMENVECDLYNYLSGKEEYAPTFKGSYLTNYSWGEITLGELLGTQGQFSL